MSSLTPKNGAIELPPDEAVIQGEHAVSSAGLSGGALYPNLPTAPTPTAETKIETADALNDVIKDVGAMNEKEEAVKDIVTEKTVDDAEEPTEKVVLLEPEDLEAPSPYRQPSSVSLTEVENGESRHVLVAPARKKGEKLREKEVRPSSQPTAKDGAVVFSGSPFIGDARPIDDADDARWWLYLAEIFGRWGDRMWHFTSALFLLELFPGDMLLPAIHGFVTGLCIILLGALIGEWVDRTPRLRAVRVALITQNTSVALGSLILTFAFVYKDSLSDTGKLGCVFGFLIFAVIGDCASVAMNIIVEKDWVVVIAGGSKTDLADMNATIRRIDLTCQILSPIIIAQIMTFGAHYIGTIVVSLWNLLSMVAEYFILHKIYQKRPSLAVKTAKTTAGDKTQQRPLVRKIFRSCFALRDGWQSYFRNRVAPAGLGLAFLYMTVMSFSGVTNTYVRTQGLSESVIAIMMAIGAVTGIAGTFVYPILRRKVGLERTGLFALATQIFWLAFCVLSIWLPGSPFRPEYLLETENSTWVERATVDSNVTAIDSGKWVTRPLSELPSVIVFMIGMIGARFGLWMADLTITQLIQENVAEKERGVVGGVQSSLNRFMDMLKFILVICLPYPATFGILIIVSFLFVFGGDCFYAYYSYKTRGHLLPHCGPAPVANGHSDIFGGPSIVLNHRDIVPTTE